MAKNEVDIIFQYFAVFLANMDRLEPEPTQKASIGGPLSIDIVSFPRGLKLAKLEKMEKLKTRHLIQNPFIIYNFLNFITKLQPGRLSFSKVERIQKPNLANRCRIECPEPSRFQNFKGMRSFQIFFDI